MLMNPEIQEKNIFAPSQQDYYTAALISKGDFDASYILRFKAIAAKVGTTSIHANELGLGCLEAIAADLFDLILKSGAYFFVSRVEKKYLLATKMFDVLFDSRENAAIAWHNYNIKPMRIILAFKLGHIIDDTIARVLEMASNVSNVSREGRPDDAAADMRESESPSSNLARPRAIQFWS
jgi:hypothetical protein